MPLGPRVPLVLSACSHVVLPPAELGTTRTDSWKDTSSGLGMAEARGTARRRAGTRHAQSICSAFRMRRQADFRSPWMAPMIKPKRPN
jgi:hypothetical protein